MGQKEHLHSVNVMNFELTYILLIYSFLSTVTLNLLVLLSLFLHIYIVCNVQKVRICPMTFQTIKH